MKKYLFQMLALVLLSIPVIAQHSQGVLTMEVQDVKANSDEAAMMVSMMQGAQLKIAFKGKQSSNEIAMMGGMMKIRTFFNADSGNQDMLMVHN